MTASRPGRAARSGLRRRGRLAAGALALTALSVLSTACSAVPTTSAPRIAQSLASGGADVQSPSPPPRNTDARGFVQAFLDANAQDPVGQEAARQYLSAGEGKVWSPGTKTTSIIASPVVGNYDQTRHTLTVSGRTVGTLSPQGIYTPGFGEPTRFTFGLARTSQSQWRITSLSQPGLVISQDAFESFQQRIVYFYDAAGKYLVPDLRYSAITDPAQLAVWLLGQLAGQPRPELSSVVGANSFPTQQRRATVSIGPLTKVQIAGSSQLAGAARDRLAAQVARTLQPTIPGGGELEIVDSTKPVEIPDVNGSVFVPDDFTDQLGPGAPQPTPQLFYLRDGRIRLGSGRAFAGPVNVQYRYSSVALARERPAAGLEVAGVVGSGTGARLYVGTQSGGLVPTTVKGALSRPAWAPGTSEVWVGDGSKLLRVLAHGSTASAAEVAIPSSAGGGRVLALRFSPDGSRIALILAGANGTAQLYIGAIVRSAGVPQVASPLQLISPPGVKVSDVGWNYDLTLTAIGSSGAEDPRIYETVVDGSRWSARGYEGLPGPPTSIALTTGAAVSVSAQNSIWIQDGNTWDSAPGSTGQTAGTSPVYLE